MVNRMGAGLGLRRGTKPKRWLWAVAATGVAAVFATAVSWWGGQFATQDADFVIKRLQADRGPSLGPPPRRSDPPFPVFANACHPRAQAALIAAVGGNDKPLTIDVLENVLVLDPDCTAAMRLAVGWAAHTGQLTKLFSRLIGRAEREPLSAEAQVGAAMFSDYAGHSGDMQTFLSRAQGLRKDLPLLATTWANYHRFHTKDTDWAKVLAHWKSEIAAREDPQTLAELIGFYVDIPDRASGLEMCNRFYAAAPQYAGSHPARACLKIAVELNDPEALAHYKQRFGGSGEPPECQERWITYFGLLAGHKDARLRAVQTNADCPQVFPWLRGVALLEQGQTAVAAAALSDLKDTPTWVAAATLALRGQREAAVTQLQAAGPEPGTVAHALLPLLKHDLIELQGLRNLFARPRPSSEGAHHAEAACGYLERGLTEAAQARLAKATSLAPDDEFVAACQLRWFVSRNDQTSAQAVANRVATPRPSSGLLQAELGHWRTRQGNCTEAVELLESARVKLPLHPTIYGDLALCLRRLGRNSEADRWALATATNNTLLPWFGGIGAVLTLFGVAFMLVRRHRSKN